MENYSTCPMCKSKLNVVNSMLLDIVCNICGYYKIPIPLFIRLHEDQMLKDKLCLIASDIIYYSSKYENRPFIITQDYLNNLKSDIKSKSKLYRLTCNIYRNMKNIGDVVNSKKMHRFWASTDSDDDFIGQLRTLSKFGIIELKEVTTADAGTMIISAMLKPNIFIDFENEEMNEEELYKRYIRGENINMSNINVNGDGNIIGDNNKNNSINIDKNNITQKDIEDKLKSLGVESETIKTIETEIKELSNELSNKKPNKEGLRNIFKRIKDKLGTIALPVFKIALSNYKEIVEIIESIGNGI